MTSSAACGKQHGEPGKMREFGAQFDVAEANISITAAHEIVAHRQNYAEGADAVIVTFSFDLTAEYRVNAVGEI